MKVRNGITLRRAQIQERITDKVVKVAKAPRVGPPAEHGRDELAE